MNLSEAPLDIVVRSNYTSRDGIISPLQVPLNGLVF
ncbi:uncharacterized protein METZ01_LOCUS177739 [marine metagenome]|uniref:Uncharacterized protein n=1 Tax=marine metagenome TaxID=408172 RepID=A0A382CFL3_9ZZZZ